MGKIEYKNRFPIKNNVVEKDNFFVTVMSQTQGSHKRALIAAFYDMLIEILEIFHMRKETKFPMKKKEIINDF